MNIIRGQMPCKSRHAVRYQCAFKNDRFQGIQRMGSAQIRERAVTDGSDAMTLNTIAVIQK